MKRGALVLLLALGACSKADRDPPAGQKVDLEAADVAAPRVAVTAAPGVAFNYHYAFKIPDTKISAVQEEHAAACEKLGIGRCRITGMRYMLDAHEHVDAQLLFKLDPALARAFGKDGIAAVTRVEGKLIESDITGDDAGAVVADTDRKMAQTRAELTDIEARLKGGRYSAVGARQADLDRAAELRTALNQAADTHDAAQASLATTPMTFDYASGDSQTGYAKIISFGDAVGAGWDSFATLVSFLTLIVLVVGPWAILAAAIFWLVRRVHRRLVKQDTTG